MIRHLLLVVVLVVSALPIAAQSADTDEIVLLPLAAGLDKPVEITHAGDARLFIIEQEGRIRVFKGGRLLSEPFLDLTARVSCCGEQGLLGLAFPPDYAETGTFFVNYTASGGGHTVIERFSVSDDSPDRADPDSGEIVLSITQPFSNHNGGQLRFGPAGMLWIGMGDGGSGGDPMNNAQSLDTLLGKMLRIDVAHLPYTIPPDNPFAGQAGARQEIWSYGWRNPWRFSFDRLTSDLFVGDVGQGDWEEIDMERPGEGGKNYGWRIMEGVHCFNPGIGCNTAGLTLPMIEYDHSLGCSVTAGFRYRGERIPSLKGAYVYGDFCSGIVWRADEMAGEWTRTILFRTSMLVTAFGEDASGELYIADYGAGVIYSLERVTHRRRVTRRP